MTSRSLFFKEVRNELRRGIWAPVLSLIGFFFCLPLPCILAVQNYYTRLQHVSQLPEAARLTESALVNLQNMLSYFVGQRTPASALGIAIMATLCGVAFFRYLHDRRQVDLFHALPVDRSHLFAVRYCTGVFAVLPIYIVMHLLTAGVLAAMGFCSMAAAAQGILLNVVMFLCLYAVAIFCTVLTGNTVAAVAFGMWFSFAMPMGTGLVALFERTNFDTFAGMSNFGGDILTYGSPLICYGGYTMNVLGGTQFHDADMGMFVRMLITYGLSALLMTALCLFLFRIRRSERAGTAVSFEGAKLPIKVIICLMAGAAGYLFFETVFGFSPIWAWFGLAVGVIFAHALLEIIYHADFRKALAHPGQMAVIGAVLVALVLVFKLDLLGYDRYLPQESSIEAVSLSGYTSPGGSFGSLGEDALLTDPALIADVHALAAQAVDAVENGSQPGTEEYTDGDAAKNISLTIYYKLKSGRTAKREYYFTDDAAGSGDALLHRIRSNPEFIRIDNEVWQMNMEEAIPDTMELSIRTNAVPDGGPASYVLTKNEDCTRVIEAMQQAALKRPLEVYETEAPVLRMDISYFNRDNSRVSVEYLPVYAEDTEVLALIESLSGVVPENLSSAVVKELILTCIDQPLDGDVDVDVDGAAEVPATTEQEKYGVTYTETNCSVTDPAQIDALLANAVGRGMLRATNDMLYTADRNFVQNDRQLSYTVTAVYRTENGARLDDMICYPEGKFPKTLIEQLFAASEATETPAN